MSKHVVAAVVDLPPGSRRLVRIGERAIVVFNIAGEFFALANSCPHQGASLHDGVLTGLVESDGPGDYRTTRRGEILRCPWHGWEYDVRTGKSWCRPQRIRLKDYEVRVEPGRTLVEGPYAAETFPVVVDAEYVVIEV